MENALAAAGVAWVAGMSLAEIARGLSSAPQIPGRLERVAHEPVTVLIDFAHTPDALERVLNTLRPLVEGRLLVLFGAGGDRDKGKRPRMGEVVSRLADLSFVTSDNPRTEDPEAIIDDIVAGMGAAPYRRIGRPQGSHRRLPWPRLGPATCFSWPERVTRPTRCWAGSDSPSMSGPSFGSSWGSREGGVGA